MNTNDKADKKVADALFQHIAVGDPTLCYQALAAGASAQARNDDGLSPMQVLIRSSAGMDKANLALCTSLLLTYGADPDERDPATGKTVLMEAAQHGCLLSCQLLLRRGADQKATVEDASGDPINRHNALDFAMRSKNGGLGMDDVCRLLLFYSLPPDDMDYDGAVPLHRLASYVAEGLPDEGLSKAGIDAICNTVGMLAAENADPSEADSNGDTPLHYLARARSPSPEVIRLFEALIGALADVNARNNVGNTPLHLTLQYDISGQACRLLLKHGANPTIGNGNGFSSERMAKETGSEAVIEAFSQTAAAAHGLSP